LSYESYVIKIRSAALCKILAAKAAKMDVENAGTPYYADPQRLENVNPGQIHDGVSPHLYEK
jgi:hypothetical protein